MAAARAGRQLGITGRVAGWVRSFVSGRGVHPPPDLVVLHGIHWITMKSSPLRQPICPRCSDAGGVPVVLECQEAGVSATTSIDDVMTFRCPGCSWSGEVTREQEREARGGAARHAMARSMGIRWR